MNIVNELAYLQAASIELEPYLLTNELYWPLQKASPAPGLPFPRLTIGGIKMAEKAVEALCTNPDERFALERVTREIDTYKQKWRTKWEEKALRELKARLNLWRNYLQEYRQNPELQADFYLQEVRWRVKTELLKGEVGEIPSFQIELLESLDLMLKAIFEPGDFIWQAELSSVYPEDPFWYLYGKPRKDLQIR